MNSVDLIADCCCCFRQLFINSSILTFACSLGSEWCRGANKELHQHKLDVRPRDSECCCTVLSKWHSIKVLTVFTMIEWEAAEICAYSGLISSLLQLLLFWNTLIQQLYYQLIVECLCLMRGVWCSVSVLTGDMCRPVTSAPGTCAPHSVTNHSNTLHPVLLNSCWTHSC